MGTFLSGAVAITGASGHVGICLSRRLAELPNEVRAWVSGTPERGAVVQRARELVTFARRHGYSVDELVEIIEDVA